MSGKHTYNVQSFTPEALARIARRNKGRKPKGTRHRADAAIDQGDTLAELRAAWGKDAAEGNSAKAYRPAQLGSGKPLDMAKVSAAVRRFGV